MLSDRVINTGYEPKKEEYLKNYNIKVIKYFAVI